MRIRKRKVPLPFSSISPVPLPPDPNYNRSPVVQLPLQLQQPLPQPPPPMSCFDPRPLSDHTNNQPIGKLPTQDSRDSSPFSASEQDYKGQKKKEDFLQGDEAEKGEGEEEEEERSNDNRKKNVLGADLGTGSSSSHQVVVRWGEGEKAFPLKKRRGSFERRGISYDDDGSIMVEDDSGNNKKVIKCTKMKTKMNKKYVQQQSDEQGEKESKDNGLGNINHGSAKRRGRGGALMEGSRCSRVNGRGWRCCQQTLVGYSLCEHHLGKGRLRSMNSVRNRSLKKEDLQAEQQQQQQQQQKHPNVKDDHPLWNTSPSQQTKQNKHESLHGDQSGRNGIEQEEEDQKPLMMTKKRAKLGMVKARSISSLLGQNDNAIAVLADENNK